MYKLNNHITGFIYNEKTRTIMGAFICVMDKQDKKTIKDSLVDRNEVFVDNNNVNEVINKFARITNSIAGLNDVVTWRW
jgi:predicted component of type VI protein secretion system